MTIQLIVADYQDAQQAQDIGYLLNCYAEDPMGGGAALTAAVRDNLAAELAKLPHALSILAYVDGQPAGLANCFMGFSTFKCKPLLNIHDLVVATEYRGLGLSQRLLGKIEDIARNRGCCKITLEVLQGNAVAQQSYRKFGFSGYELDPAKGQALFWEKPLPQG